jgi:hypothetical protein
MRLPDFPGRLGRPPIFSAGWVEVRREAVSLSENRLQKGVEPFGADHRFLQPLESDEHSSIVK